MKYNTVYSRFLMKISDSSFTELPTTVTYDIFKESLHNALSEVYMRKVFNTIVLDDETDELTYQLKNSVDEFSDEEFVSDILSEKMAINWVRSKVDTSLNLAMILGGKEEKKLNDNYKDNVSRLDSLEKRLKKKIRDYGYQNIPY